ncbi:MAG: cell division protein ZapA [Gammaproteobacteria bacterium]|nr:cell division protein ZapA [Gammaproteobacteria bacterium]
MSSKPSSVNIRILDKEYTVACPEGEEMSLLASADLLNKKILDIKNRGSILGSERIAVMAALNLAHECITTNSASSNLSDVDQRIHSLKEKINSALGQIELK